MLYLAFSADTAEGDQFCSLAFSNEMMNDELTLLSIATLFSLL